jgi:pimeloyl-ACP methyl ester carboxylesterase
MGGKTAMTLALSQSHLVDQLVILDVAPSTAPGIDEMMNYIKLLKSLDLKHITDRRQASELLKPDIPDISVRSFLLTNLTRKGPTLEWRFNLNAIEENMLILKSFPNFDKEQYNRPTLFIGGDKSNYIRPEIYPEIKRLFPVAQIKLIEDCGHWIHADKPNELIQILKDFFN